MSDSDLEDRIKDNEGRWTSDWTLHTGSLIIFHLFCSLHAYHPPLHHTFSFYTIFVHILLDLNTSHLLPS